MIRTVWFALAVVFVTLYYGSIVIGAALFRARGDIYTRSTRNWARTLFGASGCDLQVEGMEYVRADRPQVVVCNHVSMFDVLALASVLPLPFYFVAKKELERVPLFGPAWKAAGHISIDRSDRQKAIASLREAGRKIREENATVIIFPEGTRSPAGTLLPFKKGAFVLAAEANVPVVPAVVQGSERVIHNSLPAVRPTTVRLRFSEPLPTYEFSNERIDPLVERVRERMAGMLSQPEASRRDLPS